MDLAQKNGQDLPVEKFLISEEKEDATRAYASQCAGDAAQPPQ
jgi:hypothetical protein